MESEIGCWRNYGNGVQFQPTWIQSNLSDLEENTKSMMELINLQNGDSFAQRAEWYYQKKPELEERVAKYQQLYHLLLNHYSSVLPRSSVCSVSTVNSIEIETDCCEKSPKIGLSNSDSNHELPYVENSDREKLPKVGSSSNSKSDSCIDSDQEKPLKIESSPNSNPESSVEDSDQEKSPKIEWSSNSNPQSCVEDSDQEMKSIPKLRAESSKLSEMCEQNISNSNETERENEQKNEANKKLEEQMDELMKEIELLRNQNLMLLTEKVRSKKAVTIDRIKDKERPKFCFDRIMRKISIKWLKGLVKRNTSTKHLKLGLVMIKRKISIKRFQGLLNRKKIIIEWFKDLVKRKIGIKRLKLGLVKIKRKVSIKWLKLGQIKRKISSIRRFKLFVEQFFEKFLFFFWLKCM